MRKKIVSLFLILLGLVLMGIDGFYYATDPLKFFPEVMIFGAVAAISGGVVFWLDLSQDGQQKIRIVMATVGVIVGAGFLLQQVLALTFASSPHLSYRFDWRFALFGVITLCFGIYNGWRHFQISGQKLEQDLKDHGPPIS